MEKTRINSIENCEKEKEWPKIMEGAWGEILGTAALVESAIDKEENLKGRAINALYGAEMALDKALAEEREGTILYEEVPTHLIIAANALYDLVEHMKRENELYTIFFYKDVESFEQRVIALYESMSDIEHDSRYHKSFPVTHDWRVPTESAESVRSAIHKIRELVDADLRTNNFSELIQKLDKSETGKGRKIFHTNKTGQEE